MKKILFFAATLVAVLSSCSKNEVFPNETESNEVTFGVYSSIATKGEITTNATLADDGIGIFGFFQDGETGSVNPDWTAANTPNFMFNKKLTSADNGSTWTYNPVNYWSNDASDSYSFFAYGPHDDNAQITVKSANDDAGAPVITYTMPANPQDAVDFVAGQTMNVEKATNTTVGINLKHQLTRVGFEAKSSIEGTAVDGSDKTTIVVKSISVNGATIKVAKSADYTFNTVTTSGDEAVHTDDGAWSNYSYGTDALSFLLVKDNPEYGTAGVGYDELVGKEIKNNLAAGVYTSLMGSGDYQYMIPPATALAEGDQELTILYDIVTEDPLVENGYTHSSNQVVIDVPDGAFAQGKAYNFQITFTLTKVTLNPIVLDWDDENATGTLTETSGIPTTI